ncbi:potassium-transporting ATPase subunit KdpB [Mesoterricola sediminis]|uniref:Potassium-transporting ATPase ATP-binding subunit n=1 Tax=Mesoterricola sediminis TaxID=2927980 RepID=A0AA48GWW0_9BACT|nr:potassium-transporting ATPase subunit KdpB [Mesoterricola sediminis]BDU75557.1 potassium-transporting ATPase ATP-binding subunit [Mesoterricola sediminis]
MSERTSPDLLRGPLLRRALLDAFRKLDPRHQIRNPVMCVVWVCSVFVSLLWLHSLGGHGEARPGFILQIALWLWFTLYFANAAEALAEGRGKAQADALRASRRQVTAKKLAKAGRRDWTPADSAALDVGDLVLVEAGDTIPLDGEVVEGIASVNEAAVTGESAPVIRESGGDRSAVTGGTEVLSDWIVVRVTHRSGDSFLDRMIAMVEGAKRRKTPNEIALDILLAALTLVFLLAVATLLPFSQHAVRAAGSGSPIQLTVLVSLLVCLIPTTIGGLLSAIGIAGMDRMIRANVIATSGRAVEAAGDVDVLLLDKTGTITLGNREAVAFLPAPGVDQDALAEAAQLASLPDETPEGRSVVVLAKEACGLRERDLQGLHMTFVPFTAQTRMSGVDLEGRRIRKGATEAVAAWIQAEGGTFPPEVREAADAVAREGGTPLVVAEGGRALGVIQLKDIVKGGIRERFAELRRMGIKTVMVTGDNPLTAAAIAAEAGVDDFLAQATPERKLRLIRDYQAGGRLVAMTGDGTNDAPALAQADVAVAMNTGTQAAKEAGNMVDLDSNPTKLIEIVRIGKQMLMTRGSLTTFSIANDVAKYFAILPAAFLLTYPQLRALDVMRLHSPESAVLSAVIFNALIIVALIPLALRGVAFRTLPAAELLRRNLLVYGLGGLAVPFVGIKALDLAVTALHLV